MAVAEGTEGFVLDGVATSDFDALEQPRTSGVRPTTARVSVRKFMSSLGKCAGILPFIRGIQQAA